MKIRPLREDDILHASKITGENYSLRYAKNSIREMRASFDNPVIAPKYVVAEDKGKIVGYGGYIQSWMDYHVYNLFWINVSPNRQREGIGTKIVKRLISEIKRQRGMDKKALMILLTTSKPKFYSKCFGFKVLTKFKHDRNYLMCLKF